MKVAFVNAPMSHFSKFINDLAQGAERCGDKIIFVGCPPLRDALAGANAAVVWGWRRALRCKAARPELPVLVMERGYVGDRFHWTSLGWNGLNGRAIFPRSRIDGDMLHQLERWVHIIEGDKYWQAWRDPAKPGYALILGQVPSDAACANVNLAYQYRAWRDFLVQRGHTVKFRPHPKARGQGNPFRRAECTYGTLAEDLAGAKFTVSWNSNSSVDSVLSGVPSVTFDKGAMAWPVTSHDLDNPVTMPYRTEWAAQLAWCQWQPSELADGTAWRAVREVMP